MAILREEPVIPVVRKVFLPPPPVASAHTSSDAPAASSVIPEDDVDGAAPEILPPVLPMKAALYFDSADGFGEWRILISTRADRDLRQARKRDAKTFKIYVKKIK